MPARLTHFEAYQSLNTQLVLERKGTEVTFLYAAAAAALLLAAALLAALVQPQHLNRLPTGSW